MAISVYNEARSAFVLYFSTRNIPLSESQISAIADHFKLDAVQQYVNSDIKRFTLPIDIETRERYHRRNIHKLSTDFAAIVYDKITTFRRTDRIDFLSESVSELKMQSKCDIYPCQ